MSSNKQGVEEGLSGETHISSALSRLAKLRFLKIKRRTKGAATDLIPLALGREQNSWGMVLLRNLHQKQVLGGRFSRWVGSRFQPVLLLARAVEKQVVFSTFSVYRKNKKG